MDANSRYGRKYRRPLPCRLRKTRWHLGKTKRWQTADTGPGHEFVAFNEEKIPRTMVARRAYRRSGPAIISNLGRARRHHHDINPSWDERGESWRPHRTPSMNDKNCSGSPPNPAKSSTRNHHALPVWKSRATRGWVQRTYRHRILSNIDVTGRLMETCGRGQSANRCRAAQVASA